MLLRRAFAIWRVDDALDVSRSMPVRRARREGRVEVGPGLPWVPARSRAWQEPHFCTNSVLPFTRSGSSSRPQAAERAAPAATASGAASAALPCPGEPHGAGSTIRWRGRTACRPGSSSSRPSAAAITPSRDALPASSARRRARPARRCARSRSAGRARASATSFAAICLDRARADARTRAAAAALGRAPGASVAVTSAMPEWAADSGSAPQAAASAATIPNASGKRARHHLRLAGGQQVGQVVVLEPAGEVDALGGLRRAAAPAQLPVQPVEEGGAGSAARPAARPPARGRARRSRAASSRSPAAQRVDEPRRGLPVGAEARRSRAARRGPRATTSGQAASSRSTPLETISLPT